MPIAVVPLRCDSAVGGNQQPTEDSLVNAMVWNADDPHSDPSDIVIVHKAVRIGDLPKLAGAAATDTRSALYLDSRPRRRRTALSALRSIDGIDRVVGIEASVAAFANSWHLDPTHDSARPLRIVSIGHPDACSMVVGHTGERQLVAIGPVGRTDHIAQWTRAAARFSQKPLSIDVPSRWPSILSRVGSVITYGLGPTRCAEFDSLFGPLAVHHSSDGILDGLTRLGNLADWSARWPTTSVHLGPGWKRRPGPLSSPIEEHVVRLRARAQIRFSDDGALPVPVRAGSVLAQGCAIPDRLGTQLRLELIDDGRLRLSGPPRVRPLAIELSWPIPASGRNHVDIRSASRSGVELTEPFFDARVDSVDGAVLI